MTRWARRWWSALRRTRRRAALAEERLALALDDTGIGVFELDFEANRAFVSPSLCRLLGQPVIRGQIALDAWLEALHPSHLEESRRAIEERWARGEHRYEREQCIELAGGGVRWLLTWVQLEPGASGRLARARGATIDITARKEAEEQLKRVQAELTQQVADLERLHAFSRQLVTAGDDLRGPLSELLAVVVDLHAAEQGYVALREATGEGLQVVAQRGDVAPGDLAPGDERAGNPELNGVRRLPLRSAEGESLGEIAVRGRKVRPPTARESRLSEVFVATAAAVIGRQRARAAAAENERRFAVTLEASAVPFTILTPVRDETRRIVDFRWTYANPAAARALGVERGELVGRRIAEHLPGAWDPAGLFARYVGVIERGEGCEFEIHTNATGRGGWFNVIAVPLEGSMAVWFANINERKQQEQALQDADRRKDEFLATLAHELRNPLAPMRQAVRVVRSASATEYQRQWSLDVIERQVQNMSLLLDDLLDVSRITRGALLIRKSPATLAALVESAVEIARPLLDARRHRLEIRLPAEPVHLYVDPLRLSQVLGNLLTNAAKYTDSGGRVEVAAGIADGALRIEVSDDGIGLSAGELTRLFTMFSQLGGGIGRSQGGLGIGLALSRGLVELHGGRLEAASAGPGRGSQFTITLPREVLAAASGSSPPGAAAASRPPPGRGAPRRILVADDNADAADSLAELLRLGGHEVRVAYDGEAALQQFRAFVPDLALLDIGMPQRSGLEVVQAIRKLPEGGSVLLAAITGWGQEPDRQRALAAGFDHHLTKPLDPARLEALIARTEPTAG